MRAENPIGRPFYELSEVDSTNNYAMRQAQAHLAEHGSTWFTWYQNAGKGQREKPWNAEAGKNLMMSILINPATLSIDNQFILNVSIALACFDFFNFYTSGDAYIKWPNDIYWKDRKAGGILIENAIQGKEWRYSVVGIGLNINQTLFPPHLPNPVSLKQITGKTFDPITLAKELCEHAEKRWQQLGSKKYDELLQEYSAHLYKSGEMVTLQKEKNIFQAVVKGVTRRGELVVQPAGEREDLHLSFGSVRWILQ